MALRNFSLKLRGIKHSYLSEVNMYAVIKTGGKQYRVAAGEKLKVEQITAEPGQEITISDVLALGLGETISVGTPLVAGAAVKATVLAHGRADKVKIFKMRRRKHYQKRQGHRQWFTELFITEISGGGQSANAAAPVISKADDLTIVEGIGGKIAELLRLNGTTTFAQLADAKVETLSAMLKGAGGRFALHKPDTWPQQALLARDGKWDELKTLQDALDSGVDKR
jgi:large subunit ribosomal protein L21